MDVFRINFEDSLIKTFLLFYSLITHTSLQPFLRIDQDCRHFDETGSAFIISNISW